MKGHPFLDDEFFRKFFDILFELILNAKLKTV